MTADLQTIDPGILGLRRSPLAHRTDDLAACTGRVALVELPFLSMVNLRVLPGTPAAIRVQEALGVPLPEAGSVASIVIGEVDGVVTGQVRSVLWLGPDEWLVVGPDGDTVNLISLLVEAVADDRGSVVDVSANRSTLVVSGPSARDLLEKGCTLDLHPRAFGAGRCAQTTFARGHVLLWQTANEVTPGEPALAPGLHPGPTYRLLLRSSFADYFADWLLDAAAEFALV